MSNVIYQPERRRQAKGVLFDMDGVILDTEKLYSRFWREACACYGFQMSYEQSLRMRALNHADAQKLLTEFFGPTASHPLLRSKRIALMGAHIARFGAEPKPGIYELLDALEERGIPSAVCTASPIDRVRNCLEPLGLMDRFARICTVAEVENGKPAPDIFLFGARCLGVAPEDCLALEDSPNGLLAAARAGCMSTMVPDLDAPDDNTKKIVYAVADTLFDVIDLLE